MTVLARLRRLLQAALGDLVDRAKDPELELARFVEEVEISLGEVRAEIEEAELRRGGAECQLGDCRRDADGRMAEAEKHAARDEDEAAKKALRRYHEVQDEIASCEERLAEAELSLATLRKDEAGLETKLKEARLEQRRLSAKLRRAEAEKRASAVLDAGKRADIVKGRVGERIIETQSAGEARREVETDSIESQFARIEAPSLDEELAALKRRVKKA